jgi:hypothetical protein
MWSIFFLTFNTASSSKNVGAIIGSIFGAIVVAFLTLFLCKIYHNRRRVQRQERQMTDSWLSRPFSRIITRRGRYRDIEMPSDIPAVYGHRDSYQDTPLEEPFNEAFMIIPSTPTTPMSPAPLLSKSKSQRGKALKTAEISGPIGPVTIQGDPTALLSAVQLGASTSSQLQDPFLEPSSYDHDLESTPLNATMTVDPVTHHRPASSIIDPFMDLASLMHASSIQGANTTA